MVGRARPRLLPVQPGNSRQTRQAHRRQSRLYDRAEAVGAFIQRQIRYFVIELGVGGFQPHAAADIFHNRHGDCKDKASLLSAMLSSVGIHSAVRMFDTRRGVIDPDAPSILGNHAIGAIEQNNAVYKKK